VSAANLSQSQTGSILKHPMTSRPEPVEQACTLALKTIPNAPRTEVVGWLGDALKVKVHAPALDGRANDALMEFLAKKLGLPRRAVTLVRGDKSRHKVVRMQGLTLAEAKARLTTPSA
jgi:uncharacterized protein (TIGR00251 family)